MNANRIEVGDLVLVRLLSGASFSGVVDYLPQATGDCWTVISGGVVHDIQIYEEIVLVRKDYVNGH